MMNTSGDLKTLWRSRKPSPPSAEERLDAHRLHQLYNDILKPLTLFPSQTPRTKPERPGDTEQKKHTAHKKKENVDENLCKEDIYTCPVAPFLKDILSASPDVLCDVIRRRLHGKSALAPGSTDVRQIFEEIILGEVSVATDSIPSVLCTALLTSSGKRHLHRRLLSHLMIVSEQLFLHYLLKMDWNKSHSLFSHDANLTRCKAQLLLDCSKFFNVFSIRHHLIVEIRELEANKPLLSGHSEQMSEEQHTTQMAQHANKKSATYKRSKQNFTMEYFIRLGRPNIAVHKTQRETDLMQIENIQRLDIEKVYKLIPRQEDCSKFIKDMHYAAVTTPCSFGHEKEQETEGRYRRCITMKKCSSCPNLRTGDLLAEELRITFKPYAAECPEIASTSQTEEEKENPISDDLRRLIQDSTLQRSHHEESQSSDEEIPPLIRAIGPGYRNTAKRQKMEALLQDLNKKSNGPKEKQKTETIPHPQGFTIDVQIPNRPLARRMDVQASDRIFTHLTEIQKYPPIYNDFASEIEAATVQKLDRNLYVGQELEEVYTELVKNLSTNHLRFDQDLEFEPYASKLNFSVCAASSTLTKKTNQRVINKELDSLAAIDDCDSTIPNMPVDKEKETTRMYSSWLAWWKSVVNTDDYMKYISTQDMDYLKVVYHLYNSDSEDEEKAHIALLKKQEEQKRQRKKKIADLRAEKQNYKPGMWNVNSVMLGGLGSDPPIQDAEWEIEEPQDASSQVLSVLQKDIAGSSADLQKKINAIWNALHVPEGQRLDMAIKYSSNEYRDRMPEAIHMWEQAVKLIQRREKMMAELEVFEREASDPNRFFQRGYSGTSFARMEESKQRKKLHKQIADVENPISKILQAIKRIFNDTVSYKGRPYAEKIKWDKTEMLYWLQQDRRKFVLEMDIKTDSTALRLDPVN
ncbi:coiled-coil domain-containing protein 87 isoform X2 [Hyperolius riggenbachi]|uniref:coiled-coil domain-containing protein 87 isoform X2 n=1 Tax=Hyperolius riggenbachi TaxID=752182 RepID=UPI0035A3992B